MQPEEERGAVTGPESKWRPSKRVRDLVAGVLVVITCLAVLASTLAVWSSRTLFRTERFGELASRIIEQPHVQEDLAAYTADQVMTLVDAEDRIAKALPEELEELAPMLSGAARTTVDEGVKRLLDDPRVQELLVRALERAHAAMMKLLKGDGGLSVTLGGLKVDNGTVSLNLLPLLGRALRAVQEVGLISEDRDLPDLDPEASPSEQIAELEETFDVDLADDFAQFTLYESERVAKGGAALEQAQDAVVVLRRALVLLVILTLVLMAAAVAISTRRWRTGAQLAGGVMASMILATVAVNRVVEVLPARIEESREAGSSRSSIASTREVLDVLTSRIREVTTFLAVVAAVVALLSFLMGGSRPARAIRARLQPVGQRAGHPWAVISRHRDASRILAGAGILLVLVVGGLRWWSVVLGLVLGAGIVALSWATSEEAADEAEDSDDPGPSPPDEPDDPNGTDDGGATTDQPGADITPPG